ncbi:MAG: DUF805 domain-containing protein [Alphaproteobacteria bacterium]|nr:DUF805 domain-containing protein [Alphaproteobacteria bacterium]
MANTRKKTSSSMIGFGTAITNFWTGYFDFMGRASRAEFWYGILFVFIVNWLFAVLCGGIIATIASAVLFIPTMALSVRRFRDAGIWIWLYIIPMLIIYVVPIWRGAVWYKMMSINAVTSGMVGYSLFFIVFMIFCIVVGCLPSKR